MGGSRPASRDDAAAAEAISKGFEGAAGLFKAAFAREGAAAIAPDHAPAIARVCVAHTYTIAIRAAGADTIRRIGQGAKPKPHDILDKTIKERSLADAVRAGASFSDDERADLLLLRGYAAYWRDHRPIGLMVRLDDLADALRGQVVQIAGRPGQGYVPLDQARTHLVATAGDARHFYTGDYDLHEAYAAAPDGCGPVRDRSPEMFEMLDRLNASIDRSPVARGSHDPDTYAPGDYAMFQHGPQASYVANQQYEASRLPTGAARVDARLAREHPGILAWCDVAGNWYLTRGIAQHDALRRLLKLSKPPEWAQAPDEADPDDRPAD